MNRNRSLLVLAVPALAGVLAACGGVPAPVSAPIVPAVLDTDDSDDPGDGGDDDGDDRDDDVEDDDLDYRRT
ncbi:MAG: hypothetical protein NTW05_17270 [Pseudonocardiales bacterium]|nr:hypothetical protein [Pseudonocardiales bacterium]